MRKSAIAIALSVALAMLVLLAASSAIAVTTKTSHVISAVDGTQQGWKHAECGINLGTSTKPKPTAKAGLSVYYVTCKGSPGPRPVGSYYMSPGMDGSTIESPYPGQCWLGTDKYNGVKLSDVTALKYWTILDYRGCDWALLKDDNGNTIPGEFKLDFINSQPPQIQIYFLKDPEEFGPENWAVFIYRPWSVPDQPGFGPKDGSLCRKWQEWDCLNQGVWMDAVTLGNPMLTWNQILTQYPNACFATPELSSGSVGYPNKFPVFGNAEAPIPTSLNVVIGARQDWNGNFPSAWRAWFQESWNANAAVDLITVGVKDSSQNVSIDEYDFQQRALVAANPNAYLETDPSYNRPQAMNIKSILDSGISPYAPYPKIRTWVKNDGWAYDTPPAGWWGGGAADVSKFNALQRAGNFNYSLWTEIDPATGVRLSTGNVYAIVGKVSGLDGDTFKLDDGSGEIDCYCPNAASVPIQNGQYVRLVGTPYGNDPYEWYYNTFNCVKWNADPALREYSHYWPWRFDTYAWNVTVMNPAQ